MVLSEDERKVYGGEVQRIRTNRGWSRKDLSEKSGVPDGTLADIETNGSVPRDETLSKILRALDVEATTFGLLDTWLVDILRGMAPIVASIPRDRRPEAMGEVMRLLGRHARGAASPEGTAAHVESMEVSGTTNIDIIQHRPCE